ncbi:hypothetical protein [Arcobacter sp. LA11]|uniref:hypothetical protein n=1 Tax=Arcobacter sp. LA11 TaxID=1898176 RepID=UPI0009352A63|nr:hypothetical protein [Arcobacter sp. LA11]
MANLLKVVFLGLAGFGLLVFLTAEKPKQIVANENVINIVKYNSLPKDFELVGIDEKIKREELFKKNQKALIIVGNHDSLAVVKELPKLFKLDIPYIMVANISAAPWFVKKMFIPGKLEELNQGSNIPMIYDFEGGMVKSLNVLDNSKIRFFAYLLNKDETISKIYEGKVKEGALDGSMNESEKKAALEPLYNLLK